MTPQPPAYETAIDLLDADHKLVKKLFIEFNALAEDGAPPEALQQLALKICQEITVHAQIEEEIFYPAVRQAVGDEAMVDEAEEEHAEAKEQIAAIEAMEAGDEGLADAVKELAEMIDHHVMEEREQMFLQAQYAALDLRGMVPELVARKKELQGAAKPAAPAAPAKKAKKTGRKEAA